MKNSRAAACLSIFLIVLASVFELVISGVGAVEKDLISVGSDGTKITISGNRGINFIDNTMTVMLTCGEKTVYVDSFGCMQDGSFNKTLPLPKGEESGAYNLSVGMYGSSNKIYNGNVEIKSAAEEPEDNSFGFCGLSKIGTVSPENCTFYVYLKNGESAEVEYCIDSAEKHKSAAVGKYTYINLPDIENGKHSIEISVTVNGESIFNKKEDFTVLRPYSHQFMDEFNVRGAVTHYAHSTMKDIDADFMDFAGIKRIRDGVKWNVVEKTSGFDWAFTDSWLKSLKEHNIGMTTVLGFNNFRVYPMYNHYNGEMVSDSNYIPRKQKDIEFYNNYLNETLKRYPYMDDFELWNEPNADVGLAAADYTDLLMNTAVRIKREHRFADISALSLMGIREFEWTKENFTTGMYPYMTAIAFHPYVQGAADTGSQEQKYEDIYKIIVENGGWKNMNITENGWSTYQYGVSEDAAAVNLVKQNILSEKYDLIGSYWYDLVDDGTDISNREHFFGIITKNRGIKPAFSAYTQLNTQLAGAIYIGEVKSGNARIFVYEKDGKPLLAAWIPGGRGEYNFGADITAEDIHANPVTTLDGSIILTDSPVYIKGASEEWFVKAAEREITEMGADWISAHGSELSKEIRENAASVFASEISMNNDAMEALHNRYKALGKEIISHCRNGEISEMKASSALYELYRIMRLVNRIYIVSESAEPTALSADIDAAIALSNERYYSDFNMMMYSEEILRYAYNCYADAEKILESSEENPVKGGVISGMDLMCKTLIEWFEDFSEFETKFNYGVITNIQLENNAYIDAAESGKQKNLVVYVNNISDANFNGTLEIYSEDGECAGVSGKISADKGSYEYAKVSFVPKKTQDKDIEIYILKLKDSSEKVISERKHEIKVYEKEKDTGYPNHDGRGNFGNDNYPVNPDLSARAVESSDKNRIFTVGGKRFVLLDKDGNGNYFVAADEAYGLKGFNLVQQSQENTDMLKETQSWKYNSDVSTNIAYWLNNDFLTKGNTTSGVNYKLPDEIISALIEKEWDVEFAGTDGIEKSYKTKAKLALMSATEWEYYSNKLGYTPYNAPYAYPDKNGVNTYIDEKGNRVNTGWWLRTPYNQEDSGNLNYGGFVTVYRYKYQPGLVSPWSVRSAWQTKYIRPVFWLDSGFFENNRIDSLSEAGALVKEEIAASDLGGLKDIYSEEELLFLGKTKISVSKDRTSAYVLSAKETEADIIFASYDENGKLTGVSINHAALSSGIGEYEVVPTKSGENEKVFLWESMDNMKPAAEALRLPSQNQ